MSGVITVIGTVFTDIKGFSQTKYIPLGRNQGTVEFSHGGVSRNVSENLAHLGHRVKFVSSVDMSSLGTAVTDRLKGLHVDVTHLVRGADGMGIWLLINDERGEQAGSVSRLPDPVYIERELLSRGDEIFSSCDHVALETDASSAITELSLGLAKKHAKPVYALPSSMVEVINRPDMLKSIECFISNDIEAARLFGARTDGTISPDEMLSILKRGATEIGANAMIVTMGARGCVFFDRRTGEEGMCDAKKVNVKDSSGAGDAFFSGTVSRLMRGAPLKEAVKTGTALAAVTIQVTSCTASLDDIRSAGLLKE